MSRPAAKVGPTQAGPQRNATSDRGWSLAGASRLRIGRPDDAAEVQADRAAARALSGDPASASHRPADGDPYVVRPARLADAPAAAAPQGLDARIAAARPEGRPLPAPQRKFFESRFGHDFRQVRIHDGPASASAARAAGARAMTLGRDIYFGAGEHRAGSVAGTELMAHELAHTLQTRPGVIARRALSPAADVPPGHDADAAGPAQSPEAGDASDRLDDLLAAGAGPQSPAARDQLDRLDPDARREALARSRARLPAGEEGKLADAPGTAAAGDNPRPGQRSAGAGAAPVSHRAADAPSAPPEHQSAAAAAASRMQEAVRTIGGGEAGPAKPAQGPEGAEPSEGGGGATQATAAGAAQAAVGRINASLVGLAAVENLPLQFMQDEDKAPGDPEAAMRLNASRSLAQAFVSRTAGKVRALLAGALAAAPQTLAAFNGAAQAMRAQAAAQGAALKAGAQTARRKIRGQAAAVRGAIGAAQGSADSAAEAGVKTARARAKAAHEAAAGGLGKRALQEQLRIVRAYAAAKAPMEAVGDEAAARADAAAATRSSRLLAQRNGESSVMDGPLHDNKLEADAEAGISVAKEYGKSFRTTAQDEAKKIPDSRGEILGKVSEITTEARTGFANQFQQIDEGAKAQETGAKKTSGQAAGQMRQALDGSARQTLAGLDSAEAEQAAGLAQGAAAAETGLDAGLAGSLSSFAEGMAQAADSLTGSIRSFVESAAEMPAPDPGELSATLANAAPDAALADMTAQVATVAPTLAAAAAEAQQGNEATLLRGAGAAIQGFEAQAKTFVEGSAGIRKQAVVGFEKMKLGTRASTELTGANAEAGFKEAVKNADAAYTQFGDQVEDNFKVGRAQLLAGLWSQQSQAKLTEDMDKYGKEAADHVQPRWKKVLKWVITIVIIVAVIAITVLSAGSLGPVGVILLGAALGAAAGAVQTIADNLLDGKPWSEGVAKAMIVGAISGAVGGAGGVLVKGVGSVAIKIGLEAGINIIGGVAGEAIGSVATGQTVNWTGALMGALVGAGIGAGLGIAGALKGKIRIGSVGEPPAFKPPAIEPPPAPASGLRGALEKAKILAPRPGAVATPPVRAPEPPALGEPPAAAKLKDPIGFKPPGAEPQGPTATELGLKPKEPIGFKPPGAEPQGPTATELGLKPKEPIGFKPPGAEPQGPTATELGLKPKEPIGFKPPGAEPQGPTATELGLKPKEPIGFKPPGAEPQGPTATELGLKPKQPIGFRPPGAEPTVAAPTDAAPAPADAVPAPKEPIGFKPPGYKPPPRPAAASASGSSAPELPQLETVGVRPRAMVIEPSAPRMGGSGPEPIRAGGRAPEVQAGGRPAIEVEASARPRAAARAKPAPEIVEPVAPKTAKSPGPKAATEVAEPTSPGKAKGGGAPEAAPAPGGKKAKAPAAPEKGAPAKSSKPGKPAEPEAGRPRTPDDEFDDFKKMLKDELGDKADFSADKMLEMYFHGDRDAVSKRLNDYLIKEAAKKGIGTAGKVKLGGKKVTLELGEFTLELKGGKSLTKQIKAFVKGLEGAHSTPQAFGKKLPKGVQSGLPGGEYDPRAAAVVLTDKPVHTTMDQPWKDAFRGLRDRGVKNITGQGAFDEVAGGINNTPGMSASEKASRIARLHDEMFVELGLDPKAKYPVPRILTIQEILRFIAKRKGK